ncbi:MAG: hypothetical protein HQL08_09525 [Nitrospirae bacterium]|nr:hypothetical protein [Nitrospirota bacterium]
MRLLDRKDKNSIPLKIDSGKSYVVLDDIKEEEYLKYAAHLLSNDLSKAVYRLETGYLFIKKGGDEIIVDARAIADDSEAKFEIDSFFEGRSAEVFDESEIPEIKRGLLSDKRVVLAIVLAMIVVFFYALFKITEPKKNIGIVRRDMASAPAPLNDGEKEKLRVIGSRRVAEEIAGIISAVRPDVHTRIAALTAQKTEVPLSVSYIVTTSKEYVYPEVGSATGKERGIWGKTETTTVALERKDIKPLENSDFDTCSMRMLGSSFYVRERRERCVDFTYEGDASKTVEAYNSIMGCCVSLNALSIANEKGKLDVTLCRQ